MVLQLLNCCSQVEAMGDNPKVTKYCLRRASVTREQVDVRYLDFNPSKRVKCFYNCFLNELNVIEDNRIIPGGFRRAFGHLIQAEAINRVESKCHSGQIVPQWRRGRCSFGFRLFQCYQFLKIWDLKKNRYFVDSDEYIYKA
ncbi:hypothetical protein KR032_010690 [Drosophila birchii]|nr:hypothetical protein KR032_010690 [Drosophila birchii]